MSSYCYLINDCFIMTGVTPNFSNWNRNTQPSIQLWNTSWSQLSNTTSGFLEKHQVKLKYTESTQPTSPLIRSDWGKILSVQEWFDTKNPCMSMAFNFPLHNLIFLADAMSSMFKKSTALLAICTCQLIFTV